MRLYACTWQDCMQSVPGTGFSGTPWRGTSGCLRPIDFNPGTSHKLPYLAQQTCSDSLSKARSDSLRHCIARYFPCSSVYFHCCCHFSPRYGILPSCPGVRILQAIALQGNDMKTTQTGSAVRTTLITLVVITAFLAVAIMLLPKGFSSDTSVIGQGSHVVVLAHDKESTQSLDLIDLLNKVRSEYSSRIEFRVIDRHSPQGQAFLQQHQVRLGSLLFFAPDGTRLRVVSNIDDETVLRTNLDSVLD